MRGTSRIMKPKTPELIKECRDAKQNEFDAYYQTVTISVGLKHLFASSEPCVFKVNEPSMKTSDNTVTPDAIFQCDNDTVGIVCEIKTALPSDEAILLKDMKEQLEKYSKIENGWKTPSTKIKTHSILLFIHRSDAKRLEKLLKKWIAEKKIDIKTNVCIADWQSIRQLKAKASDEILFSHRYGTTACNFFDRKLKDDVTINVDDLAVEYEERKFVKADPPDLYLMTMLFQDIFPRFSINEGNTINMTIDQLMKYLTEYYTSWSGLEGEQSQIRRRWVIKIMDKFCSIKLAEKVVGKDHEYKVKWSSNTSKNRKEYLLDKLCGKEKSQITSGIQKKLID